MNLSEIDAQLKEEYPIFYMEMHSGQERFIQIKNRKGHTPKRRIGESGNKWGKCITFHTLVSTPYGDISIGELFEEGKPFEVYAWDGSKKVIAWASAPFKKPGLHQCYRLELADGRWVEVADYHNILTSIGWMTTQKLQEEFDLGFLEVVDGIIQIKKESGAYVQNTNKNEHILECIPIPCQEVYDFEVEKYHNYFAGGLIHHNTRVGIAEDLAHSWGFRPWLSDDDPDYRIDIKVPNQGLVGCETLSQSVMQKIWPEFKLLIPKTASYRPKKNPMGQITEIRFDTDPLGNKCESEIYIRSYDQDADTFEGIDYGYIHWDEPPPKKVIQAAERGKIVTNSPSWFTMTPLKEAYIYDEYSLKAFNNGGDDQEIAIIRGEIWENCADWCYLCRLDIPENSPVDPRTGLSVRIIRNCPHCNRSLGFIVRAGIDEYLKTLDPEEREAREKGLWKHLSGLVYKILDNELHIYEDFQIPRTWTKIEGIDPHDAKPVKYLFGAISPEEIEIKGKLRNRIYFYDYLSMKNIDLDELIRRIKSKREHHGYSKPKWIMMDAKYGARTQLTRNKEDKKSWEEELQHRGLGYIKLSQSEPGDLTIGHSIVREYLKPHYSILDGKSKPGVLFAREGCHGKGGPINMMFNYQYKENADKPEEEFKDFPDIVRYVCLEQPTWSSPESEITIKNILEQRKEEAYNARRRGVSS